jgi:hypothetical protein
MLALDGLTGSLSQLDLRVGGVQKAFVAWNGGDFYLGAVVGTTVIKSSNTTALTLDSSQNATFAGNIQTAAPSGGTAATWRLGTVATVSPTSPNRTIEVQIGATTYYIHAKTTND